MTPSRFLLIADVGGDDRRHIGDEAMLGANLSALRSAFPAARFTVVSRDPRWTSEHFGVDSIPNLGFSASPDAATERSEFLRQLLDQAGKHPLADHDALIISGGGNLCSTWPDLFCERVALLMLARACGKPALLLGQTIGPTLRGEERELLRKALESAQLIGVRELPSAALLRELGVPDERIWYQSDDALRPATTSAGEAQRPFIALTIDPQFRAHGIDLFDALVEQLRKLSRKTGLPLTLIPHAFGQSSAPSDLTECEVLAARVHPTQTHIAAGLDFEQTQRLTAAASLIISTRYHPIVFGLAAGVPAIGIYADPYSRIKLQGALQHAGLERWSLPYVAVLRRKLLPMALELWRQHDAVVTNLHEKRAGWSGEYERRWATIAALLNGSHSPSVQSGVLFGHPESEVRPALTRALELANEPIERLPSDSVIRRYLKAARRRLGRS